MKVIGLMSGTSVDGIDAAIVELQGQPDQLQCQLRGFTTYPYPPDLRTEILAVCGGKPLSAAAFAELDDQIAIQFAHAAQQLQHRFGAAELIGSHGQTIFHRPPQAPRETASPSDLRPQTSDVRQNYLGLSWQVGRGEVIAQLTQLPTVSNFRRADIAVGGQGAPLVPKVDAYLLAHPTKHRCIQNLGGIGNVTYLPPLGQPDWETGVIGWDTGPGNVLLDLAIQRLTNGKQAYDQDGVWAAQGQPHGELVAQWLADPFIALQPPKSTGREYFGVDFLARCWQQAREFHLSDADFLASLTEFTALTVRENYRRFLPQLPDEILLCGGGARNGYLGDRLRVAFGDGVTIQTTDEVGVNHDAKEAIAFAVLAYWHRQGFAGNLPRVTGASRPMVLGELYQPF